MKSHSLLFGLTLFVLAFFVMASVNAAPPTAAQQAQIDTLKKTYPLTTCPVSEDDLGGMGGKPIDYLYTQKNADGTETVRLVRFCCPDCVTKFEKNPEKYLKVIDAAQDKRPSAGVTPPAKN